MKIFSNPTLIYPILENVRDAENQEYGYVEPLKYFV
jgi:hypothetical protein